MNPDPTIRSASAVPDASDPRLASVNEATIRTLVYGFYGRIRDDTELGPIFNREIEEERWPEHLEKMCAFWSSVLLRTSRYGGRPLPPHLRLKALNDAHFQRWLNLFIEAARDAFDEQGAAAVTGFAERIAHSFRLSMAFHRGQDSIGIKPQRATPMTWSPDAA
jgi:hemoglobin